MAFLLLAATARNDVMSLLQDDAKGHRHQHQHQHQPQHLNHQRTKSSISDSDDDEQSEESTIEVNDNNKCQSAPSSPRSSTHDGTTLSPTSPNRHESFTRRSLQLFANAASKPKLSLHLSFPSARDRADNLLAIRTGTWRQRRRIRASAKTIEVAVQARILASPFLLEVSSAGDNSQQQQQSHQQIMLNRGELKVGAWLGRGGFCEVWEVKKASLTSSTNTNNTRQPKTKKLVLKHLQSALLKKVPLNTHHSSSGLDAFELAAVDLRMEALYLSHLQHVNIIGLKGLVQPSSTTTQQQRLPYADGRYDGFGLLLEPLSDTLDMRLEDWSRLQNHSLYVNNTASREEALDDGDRRTPLTSPSAGCLFQHTAANKSNQNGNHHQQVHLGRVLHYAAQLADALQYLHDRRIIMCDIKPSNVGFVHDHTVKLFDLGLCRELPAAPTDNDYDDDRRLYTLPIAGTPRYCAGEVLVGRKYNCFADVHSFAMVLYEMVGLQQPFGDMTPQEHYQRVAKQGERPNLDDDDNIPKAFHSILEHAWDHDPQARWTMSQVRDELKMLQQTLDVIIPQSTSTTATRRNSGSVTGKRESRHHHRRRTSLDYLNLEITDREDDDDDNLGCLEEEHNDTTEDTDGEGMTADDFELCLVSTQGR